MQTVSSEALSAFVQSAEVAAQLREGWMLHNAAVYMWNYSIHLVESGEAEPLVPYYRSLLRLMKHLASDRYVCVYTHTSVCSMCVSVRAHVCVCVCVCVYVCVCVWMCVVCT